MSGPSFVLLLLAAAIAVKAANDDFPMFAQWIAQQTSSNARVAGGYYGYGEIETERACLQQTSIRNCRSIVPDTIQYLETPATCCETNTNSPLLKDMPMQAVCSFTRTYFPNDTTEGGPIAYTGTSMLKVGTFEVTCEMRDHAERCGSPLCEGMVITGFGDILFYDKIAFTDDASIQPLLTQGPKCQELFGNGTANTTGVIPAQYYTGPGLILSGTFYTVSPQHAIKAPTGQIQLAFATGNATDYTPSTSPPVAAYIAKGSQIRLWFIGTSNKGYYGEH